MNILIDGQTLHTTEINRGIGTYFKEMIEAMLRNDFVNCFFISIDSPNRLKVLSLFAQNKLIPVVNNNYNPSLLLDVDRANATTRYSKLVHSCIKENSIDLYWNPNPQMNNTILPEKLDSVKYVATIYDLIPLVMKDIYLSKWPEFIQKEYFKKIDALKTYDHLFPISLSTQKDIIKFLKIPKQKTTIIFCGVSSRFKPSPLPKVITSEKYILYLGGFDPRKNMFRAIESFSIFMKSYNSKAINYKLYLICSLETTAKRELLEFAEKYNIADNLVLTGYVEDKDLLKLYQKAQCFFFPSLYEGFGLPILEAQASGLAVSCSNNSSLPEVAGKHVHYFDAYKSKDMAKSLRQALNENTDLESRMKRYTKATKYTWEKPARLMLKTLIELCRNKHSKLKKKIAWVSPFPPQRSGISNYSKILLMAMKNKVKIDLYYDGAVPDKDLSNHFKIYQIDNLKKRFKTYDEVIYHIGNNSDFHTNIYKYAWNYPSTIVIHDWNIHPFMQHSFVNTKEHSYYEKALLEYDKEGERELNKVNYGGHADIWKFPMSDAIATKSKRVIVHHQWVKRQFKEKSNVEVIPLYSHVENKPNKKNINDLQIKFNISKKDFLITSFGEINSNKLPQVQIQAIKELLDQGYPLKLIFAGKIQNESIGLFNSLCNSKYEGRIIATDYLTNEEYLSCLDLSDIVINLRNPSMGEASLTLTEAFFVKKAVIIGNHNQYKEFPDEIVAGKINYDGTEVEQLVKILKKVLEDSTFKEKIELNVKLYSDNVLGLKQVVSRYLGE